MDWIPSLPAALGPDAIMWLLILGVIAVLIAFLGGLRALYTPDVTPFFFRRRNRKTHAEKTSECEQEQEPHDGAADLSRDEREAA